MRALPVIVIVVAACGSEAAPPNPMPKPIAAVEHAIRVPFRGVAIAGDGIYYGRKKVSTLEGFGAARGGLLAELRVAHGAPGDEPDPPRIAMALLVVPDPSVQAPIVVAVFETIAQAGWDNINLKQIRSSDKRHDLVGVCEMRGIRRHDPSTPLDDLPVLLSILVQPGQVWIGLSRVNEFQQVLDFKGRLDHDKLELILKEHKGSAFFADRDELEIGVEGAHPVDVLLQTIQVACDVGFVGVDLRDPAKVSARPTL